MLTVTNAAKHCLGFFRREVVLSAAILLALESVFGVIFSCLLLGERVTPRMLLGFAVIFAALMVSELTPRGKEN